MGGFGFYLKSDGVEWKFDGSIQLSDPEFGWFLNSSKGVEWIFGIQEPQISDEIPGSTGNK
jgi:hypothetical protein